jgi:hypothetical protein
MSLLLSLASTLEGSSGSGTTVAISTVRALRPEGANLDAQRGPVQTMLTVLTQKPPFR